MKLNPVVLQALNDVLRVNLMHLVIDSPLKCHRGSRCRAIGRVANIIGEKPVMGGGELLEALALGGILTRSTPQLALILLPIPPKIAL